MKKAELERMKKDYVAALRIIHHQGLSDAFTHLATKTSLFEVSLTRSFLYLFLVIHQKKPTKATTTRMSQNGDADPSVNCLAP